VDDERDHGRKCAGLLAAAALLPVASVLLEVAAPDGDDVFEHAERHELVAARLVFDQ
jgi:hypothetical protein